MCDNGGITPFILNSMYSNLYVHYVHYVLYVLYVQYVLYVLYVQYVH